LYLLNRIALSFESHAAMPYYATHFNQACPTCGRTIRIPVHLLAGRLMCRHCQTPFIANDGSEHGRDFAQAPRNLDARIETLLSSVKPDNASKNR
jgi:hypothetical protein